MDLDVLDASRQVVRRAQVDDSIFGSEVKEHLLREVVVMQLANRRRGTASSKGRSEVSGSGRKPWRQKGTGRARAGTRKSPLWRHGGVTFGPKPRDWSYRVPKKVRQGALRSVLGMSVREGRFIVMDQIPLPEPKTRHVTSFLREMGLEGKVLILVADRDEALWRAARNIPSVKILPVEGLNVYDLLAADQVLCLEEALPLIERRLGSHGKGSLSDNQTPPPDGEGLPAEAVGE